MFDSGGDEFANLKNTKIISIFSFLSHEGGLASCSVFQHTLLIHPM